MRRVQYFKHPTLFLALFPYCLIMHRLGENVHVFLQIQPLQVEIVYFRHLLLHKLKREGLIQEVNAEHCPSCASCQAGGVVFFFF